MAASSKPVTALCPCQTWTSVGVGNVIADQGFGDSAVGFDPARIERRTRERGRAERSKGHAVYEIQVTLVIGIDGHDRRSWPQLSNDTRDAKELGGWARRSRL